MKTFPLNSKKITGWIALAVILTCGEPGTPKAEPLDTGSGQTIESLSALEMAERAVVDTLYYQFDKWFSLFKRRILEQEALPKTLANQLELMRLYFYMAGLYGELTHVLAFTGEYQIPEIKKSFLYYSRLSIQLAQTLLEHPEISKEDRADVYFYLGTSEGYMGLLEFGEGHLFSALVDGLRADNHLEDALKLDPNHADAHVGLGVYRYSNSRLGGLGNFLLQWGEDKRLVGLHHIETALEQDILSRPLAIKTLSWFYIAEQINPDNADLPDENPLSNYVTRSRANYYLENYERMYFIDVPADFAGNKGLTMMKAMQFIIDRDYTPALRQLEKNLEICDYLMQIKHFKLNPQYVDTVKSVIKFCRLMIAAGAEDRQPNPKECTHLNEEIEFIENGGIIIQYQSAKIRGEIQNMLKRQLKKLSSRLDC